MLFIIISYCSTMYKKTHTGAMLAGAKNVPTRSVQLRHSANYIRPRIKQTISKSQIILMTYQEEKTEQSSKEKNKKYKQKNKKKNGSKQREDTHQRLCCTLVLETENDICLQSQTTYTEKTEYMDIKETHRERKGQELQLNFFCRLEIIAFV